MRILAIDTSLSAISVCLYDGDGRAVIAGETVPMERGHAEALLPLVEDVIHRVRSGFSRVDKVAVTVGPGSFTGIRVGISAAKGFGIALEAPVASEEGGPTTSIVDLLLLAVAAVAEATHDELGLRWPREISPFDVHIVIAGKDKGKSGEIIRAIPAERRAMIAARGEKAKKGQAQARERMLQQAAANAWDASPISSSRFSAEIWNQIKNENWVLVSRDSSPSNWPHRIWTFDQHHQFIGGPGGAGQFAEVARAVLVRSPYGAPFCTFWARGLHRITPFRAGAAWRRSC